MGDNNAALQPNMIFNFGPVNSTLKPIVGDWDGDGIGTVGLYDAENGVFYLLCRSMTNCCSFRVSRSRMDSCYRRLGWGSGGYHWVISSANWGVSFEE
jgi:hypothetical protein